MSQEYDNTNRWSLFKNDRKGKDTHPDYNGTLNVDGVEYYLNAWLKDGKKGKFFSGSIKAKDERRAPSATERQSLMNKDSIDDEIPF